MRLRFLGLACAIALFRSISIGRLENIVLKEADGGNKASWVNVGQVFPRTKAEATDSYVAERPKSRRTLSWFDPWTQYSDRHRHELVPETRNDHIVEGGDSGDFKDGTSNDEYDGKKPRISDRNKDDASGVCCLLSSGELCPAGFTCEGPLFDFLGNLQGNGCCDSEDAALGGQMPACDTSGGGERCGINNDDDYGSYLGDDSGYCCVLTRGQFCPSGLSCALEGAPFLDISGNQGSACCNSEVALLLAVLGGGVDRCTAPEGGERCSGGTFVFDDDRIYDVYKSGKGKGKGKGHKGHKGYKGYKKGKGKGHKGYKGHKGHKGHKGWNGKGGKGRPSIRPPTKAPTSTPDSVVQSRRQYFRKRRKWDKRKIVNYDMTIYSLHSDPMQEETFSETKSIQVRNGRAVNSVIVTGPTEREYVDVDTVETVDKLYVAIANVLQTNNPNVISTYNHTYSYPTELTYWETGGKELRGDLDDWETFKVTSYSILRFVDRSPEAPTRRPTEAEGPTTRPPSTGPTPPPVPPTISPPTVSGPGPSTGSPNSQPTPRPPSNPPTAFPTVTPGTTGKPTTASTLAPTDVPNDDDSSFSFSASMFSGSAASKRRRHDRTRQRYRRLRSVASTEPTTEGLAVD